MVLVNDGQFAVLSDRWVIEHQVGNKQLNIDDTNPRQSVYVFGCKDSIIHVKGTTINSKDALLKLPGWAQVLELHDKQLS